MRIVFSSVLATLLMVLAHTPAFAERDDETTPTQLFGRCAYGSRVAEFIGGSNGFAVCDSVVIIQDDERASFDFRQESIGSIVRYEGDLSGDIMKIKRVHLRKMSPEPAQGSCTIYRSNGRISTVTCVATARQLTYAANFIPR